MTSLPAPLVGSVGPRLLALCVIATLCGFMGCADRDPAGSSQQALQASGDHIALALDLERELEAIARSASEGEQLWPGFDPRTVPLAVFDGQTTTLFRHPMPPEEFVAIAAPEDGTEPMAQGAVFTMPGRHPAIIANSSAEIGGVPTATVLLNSRSSRSAQDLAVLAVHESFHVYQRENHPEWAANEADLFTYPTDDAGALALRRLESEALRRALAESSGTAAPDPSASPTADAACWARQALALRTERYKLLDQASVAYERGTELNEGLATYIESRARRHLSSTAGADLSIAEFGPADVRQRSYATGPAIAALLDRFEPDWATAFESGEGLSLDQALADSFAQRPTQTPDTPSTTPCEFSAVDRRQATERAQADVAELVIERASSVQVFEQLPGGRITIDASASPLWPRGFDPLNVERVAATKVLHRRFLKLGNETGDFEMLATDAAKLMALTQGSGPHPLFNGIVSVEIAPISGVATTREDGDTVFVHAPGFTAEFRGAQLTRVGDLITIALGGE